MSATRSGSAFIYCVTPHRPSEKRPRKPHERSGSNSTISRAVRIGAGPAMLEHYAAVDRRRDPPSLRSGAAAFAARLACRAEAPVRARRLERVKGIEPSSSAWKAVALPLSYTRAVRDSSHVAPAFAKATAGNLRRPKAGLPTEAAQRRRLVGEVGLEPTKA
jgi:hypothetical protein